MWRLTALTLALGASTAVLGARRLVAPLGDEIGRALFVASPAGGELDGGLRGRAVADDGAEHEARRGGARGDGPAIEGSGREAQRRDGRGVDGGARAGGRSVAEPSSSAAGSRGDAGPGRRALRIPAASVERALARGLDRSGGVTVRDAAGAAYGVRLHGVSRFRAGLRDGDVVTHVAGRRVHDADEATEAATAVLGSGGRVLAGTVEREGEPIDVVVELPDGASPAPR